MPSPPPTVFVSGATGFIAGQIVARLLAAGYGVRGSIRRGASEHTTERLRALPGADSRLTFVEADLRAANAFAGLLEGCTYVQHVASPYVLDVTDPQRDLVDPAVQGTTAMLEACLATPGIRRVVLTSSMAAIMDEPIEGHVYSEADWNTASSLTRNPYYLSKVLAERAAWRFVDERQPPWDLIAINPFLVIGPSLTPTLNVSNGVIAGLLNGAYPAVPSLTWGIVDVRDVAEAHVRAMETASAHGRYLCAAQLMSARRLVALLREHGYGRYRLPRFHLDHPIGTWVARLAAYAQRPGVRQYLHAHLGRVPQFDNAKIRRDLAMTFRPPHGTVLDAAADLVTWGHVQARQRKGGEAAPKRSV